MSIQNEIDRISNSVSGTYNALAEAGADMPSEQNADNLPETAASIKAVLYSKEQDLTAEQKAQARANIGITDVAPTVTIEPIEGGHKLTITDVNGDKTVDIMNGADGQAPTIEYKTSSMSTGNQVFVSEFLVITRPDGTQEWVEIRNGTDGTDGKDGGYYNPVLSEDGVLSWEYIRPVQYDPSMPGGGSLTPITPWSDVKIVGRGIQSMTYNGDTEVWTVTYTDGTVAEIETERDAAVTPPPSGSIMPGTDPYIRYTDEMNLSEEDKAQARANIGAASAEDVAPLVVTISGSVSAGYTADYKSAEIYTAWSAGRPVYAKVNSGVVQYSLVSATGSSCKFAYEELYESDDGETYIRVYFYSVDPDGVCTRATTHTITYTGGTMTGPLMLAGDPTSDLEAVTKQYVDSKIGSGEGGGGGGVSSWDDLTDKPESFPPSEHTHEPEVFVAEYGVTTVAELDEASAAGKLLLCKKGGAYGTLMYGAEGGYDFLVGTEYAYVYGADNWSSYPYVFGQADILNGVEANAGFVPAPPSGNNLFLKNDGSWKAPSVAWGSVTDKPSSFPPNSHSHFASDIEGGSFLGQMSVHGSYQDCHYYLLRNSKISASAETPTAEGEICWKYK